MPGVRRCCTEVSRPGENPPQGIDHVGSGCGRLIYALMDPRHHVVTKQRQALLAGHAGTLA